MLAGFKVANFLSFKEMQSFSMIKGRQDTHLDHILEGQPELLDRAVIYGPNSAGKSNFMTAVAYAQEIALRKDGHAYCRSSNVVKTLEKMSYDGSDNQISYFEFLIYLDNRLYSYGFEYDCRLKAYSSEWLVELFDDGSENELFVINFDGNEENILSCEEDRELAADHKKDSGTSFLSKSKLSASWEIHLWLSMSLFVVVASDGVSTRRFHYNVKNKDLITLFNTLKKLDTGIDGLLIDDPEAMLALSDNPSFKDLIHQSRDELIELWSVKESRCGELSSNSLSTTFILENDSLSMYLNKYITEDEFDLWKDELDLNPWDVGSDVDVDFPVRFTHRPSHFDLPFSSESDGTRKIIEILLSLYHSTFKVQNGYTVLYDEFECSIHVMLIKELLNVYSQKRKDCKMQFITTTHESRILAPSLFRNDEIWFVDSNEKNGSKLYSLESFRDADDDKELDIEYLRGRFGAIPAVIELTEEGNR